MTNFHAHVYYTREQRQQAQQLHQMLSESVADINIYPLVDKPVGPHPLAMFHFSFSELQIETVQTWLECHRHGLSILIHPLIDDNLKAHTTAAAWLGEELELKTSIFS